jgi:hypothetical protein
LETERVEDFPPGYGNHEAHREPGFWAIRWSGWLSSIGILRSYLED